MLNTSALNIQTKIYTINMFIESRGGESEIINNNKSHLCTYYMHPHINELGFMTNGNQFRNDSQPKRQLSLIESQVKLNILQNLIASVGEWIRYTSARWWQIYYLLGSVINVCILFQSARTSAMLDRYERDAYKCEFIPPLFGTNSRC